ncbi:MAG: SRPBCC domain-containing protein [Candidatus Devosia phytovorans]|uniref:SRPBCC domain-containing protein n=1 Tax=Candidatus Devosia phytovorans TaxID=3121372 RepID=A0AAJ5VSK5_9HYPH|nr:SRPBCC domain-containing protein [Devosia sp.]WEK04048.1 MAG: SRPBCC domain-containing protein [Devosia sp.]
MAPTYVNERGISLTRNLAAPPDLVWQAWTDPDYLVWFFNPGMTPSQPTTVDLRVGGAWRQHMVVNDETQYMTGGVYREIVPKQKLVFEWGAADGWPELNPDLALLATVQLRPEGEGTRMDFRLQLPDQMSDEEAGKWLGMGIDHGWGMTIDRLVAQLAK